MQRCKNFVECPSLLTHTHTHTYTCVYIIIKWQYCKYCIRVLYICVVYLDIALFKLHFHPVTRGHSMVGGRGGEQNSSFPLDSDIIYIKRGQTDQWERERGKNKLFAVGTSSDRNGEIRWLSLNYSYLPGQSADDA